MAKILDVYLYDDLAGRLIQDEYGQMVFEYVKTWLEKPNAVPLSHSLPLQREQFQNQKCRGFFGGILPEQNQRKVIARNLGISADNDFAMLAEIGGECAGAVTFLPTGMSLQHDHETHLHHLTDTSLAKILRDLPNKPFLAGDEDVRLSLAGAQDKIVLHVVDGKFSIPLSGAFSTHIIKPAIAGYDGIVFNEAFCMKLARIVGLSAAKVDIGRVEDIDYLLVERYDRLVDNKGNILRRHQEDFCQALGVISKMKYQDEGGPSLKQCFDLLRDVSISPVLDIRALLDAVIFNFLIGNHDAHGKNFSLLFPAERSVELENLANSPIFAKKIATFAPLYDLVSTVYYSGLSEKMAMKIGRKYASIGSKRAYEGVYPEDFEKLAEEVGLAKPMLVKRVLVLAETVIAGLDQVEIDHPVAYKISALIKKRCQLVIKRFS